MLQDAMKPRRWTTDTPENQDMPDIEKRMITVETQLKLHTQLLTALLITSIAKLFM
jgi:hypothetical protein